MAPKTLNATTSDFSHQRAFTVDCLPLEQRLPDAHFHANAEIGTLVDGPGRLYFQDHFVELQPGDIYILDCVVPHGHESPQGGDVRNLYVHIKYEAIASLTPPDEYAALMRPLMLIRAGILPPVIHGAGDICALLRQAHEVYSASNREGYTNAWGYVVAACAGILSRLETAIEQTAPSRANLHEQTIIAAALYYTGRHFTEAYSVEEIAQHCCISPSRLAHVFTANLGISPIAYRNSLRINRALELLQSSLDSVEQVALATGFRSFGQFRRLFRASTGKSPREYRQQNRIGFRQKHR